HGESWVLKQALPQLRVPTAWFSSPSRNHAEAMALRWLPNLTPTETIPGLVFEEPEHHLLALPIRTLPQLSINLFSGGKHAGGQVPIQDVLIVPASLRAVDETLSMMFEIYQCAAELVL